MNEETIRKEILNNMRSVTKHIVKHFVLAVVADVAVSVASKAILDVIFKEKKESE